MEIQADDSQIIKTIDVLTHVSEAQRKKLWDVLRVVSFQAERAVKLAMPVDRGRARASWGHWSDNLKPIRRGKRGKPLAHDVKQIALAGEAEAVYEEDEASLKITQGSNVPYIEALNDGHSAQAAAGFIDVIAEQALTALDKAAMEVMEMF
jgi:hypothetical protein